MYLKLSGFVDNITVIVCSLRFYPKSQTIKTSSFQLQMTRFFMFAKIGMMMRPRFLSNMYLCHEICFFFLDFLSYVSSARL